MKSFRAIQGSPRVYHHPCRHDSWWTPERDAKLLYVIEVYDDLARAARVLGVPEKNGGWLVRRVNAYRYGCLSLTEEYAKDVELRLNRLLASKVGA